MRQKYPRTCLEKSRANQTFYTANGTNVHFRSKTQWLITLVIYGKLEELDIYETQIQILVLLRCLQLQF